MIDPGQPYILQKFAGVADDVLDLSLSSSEAGDNQNARTDELQGILTKIPGFKKIGNLGSTLLLDNCEATTGWTTSASVAIATDNTATIIGTNNLKFTVDAAFTTGIMCYKTISSTDLSAYTGVGFYFRSSIGIAASVLQFCIDDTAALASPIETVNLPALIANVWQYVYVPFANAGSTRTAIITFGLKVAVDQAAFVLNIDNIDIVRTDDMPVDLCETAWTAKTNVTSTADSTIVKVGTYSAKHVIAAGFTTGIISTDVIPSLDLSKYSYVGFWLYSTIALPSGALSLLLDDTAACASPLETIVINKALLANTWTHIVIPLASASSDTAIISVGLNANYNFGACTIYIDDIRALKPTVAGKKYPRTDGSTLLVASNGTSVYKSVDSGANWTLIAGGLNNAYFVWLCAFGDSCFWGNGSNYNMELTSADVVNVYTGTTGNIYFMPKARFMWVHQETTAMLLYATDPVTVRLADPIKLPGEVDWFSALSEYQKDLEATTGAYLVTAIAFAERSVIYLNNSFVVLSGDSAANFDWLPREFGVGCTMRESVQIRIENNGAGAYLIWANNEGIYRMDETFVPQLISDKIKNKYALLVQPNVQNAFWEQSTYPEWVAGTGGNLIDYTSVYGKIMQLPQSTQADWTAGTNVNTDLTTSSGDVLISVDGGISSTDSANAILPTADYTHCITNQSLAALTNGAGGMYIYAPILPTPYIGAFSFNIYIDLGSVKNIGRVATSILQYVSASGTFTVYTSLTGSSYTSQGTFTTTGVNNVDFITTARYIKLSFSGANTVAGGGVEITYIKVFVEKYNATSSIITQTLNHGSIPSTNGFLCAQVTIPGGCSIDFWGEAQAADSGWGSPTLLGTATSTGNYTISLSTLAKLQYKQIKAVLNTDTTGSLTPTLSSIYIGTQYISVTHNTGTKSQWGQFLVSDVASNQTINYEIRSATAEATLLADTTGLLWHPILPNSVISEPLANIWIQIRVTFDSNDYNQIPSVDWFQLNWIKSSTSTLPTTLVASAIHKERYYLFGMEQGDNYNQLGFCLDRNWNWQLIYNFPVGCCFSLNNEPYFGCAFDGRIMRMFTGLNFDFGDWVEVVESYWDSYRAGIENKKRLKSYEEFIVYYEPVASGILTLYYDIGNTGVFTSLGTIDTTDSKGWGRLLPTGWLNGKDIKIRLYNNGSNETIIIYKVEINYQIYEDLGNF